MPANDKDLVISLTLASGEQVNLDKPGGSLLVDGVVHGLVAKAPYEKPIGDIQRLWVLQDTVSAGRTIGLVAAFPRPQGRFRRHQTW